MHRVGVCLGEGMFLEAVLAGGLVTKLIILNAPNAGVELL